MECSCEFGVGDCEEFETVYFDDVVSTKKPHKCYECGRLIEPREKHQFFACDDTDSGFFKARTCLDCVSIISIFFKRGYYLGMVLESLRDGIFDVDGGISETCIASLTPAARGIVCEMVERCWNE